MLNLLANLDAKTSDLNKIKRFVKVLAFVNSTDDFGMQPQVVNGGSNLIAELFGEEAGLPAVQQLEQMHFLEELPVRLKC